MWQGSEYALEYNYERALNISGFQACQLSAHASIAQNSEYAWIWLINTLWQGSEDIWSKFHRVLVLNMLGIRIWEGCEYARVTKGTEYAWTSLSMP